MERLLEVYKNYYNKYPYAGNLGFLDLETTGFDRNARIIEIGSIIINFDGFDVNFYTFESLINPGFNVSPKITEITNITNEELEKSRGDEVYNEFIPWLNQYSPNKLIAHNAKFDKSKLENNLIRVGYNNFNIPFECTMELSRKNIKNIKSDKLESLCEYFNFQNKQAHRALADTEACAYIYAKIMLGEF